MEDLEAINEGLLQSSYTFIQDSPLRQFIDSRINDMPQVNTLKTILGILKNIIKDEQLFDPQNQSVIICNTDLEVALNMKALHCCQVRDAVTSQLLRLSGPTQANICMDRGLCPPPPATVSEPTTSSVQSGVQERQTVSQVESDIYSDSTARFLLKPDFQAVFSTLPDVGPGKMLYAYKEVFELLSRYMLSKRDSMFDHRNIELALVSSDQLGVAFNLTAFHRSQITSLVRSQLIHVPEASSSSVRLGPEDPNHIMENKEVDHGLAYGHEVLTCIDRLLKDVDLCNECKRKLLSRLHGNSSNAVAK